VAQCRRPKARHGTEPRDCSAVPCCPMNWPKTNAAVSERRHVPAQRLQIAEIPSNADARQLPGLCFVQPRSPARWMPLCDCRTVIRELGASRLINSVVIPWETGSAVHAPELQTQAADNAQLKGPTKKHAGTSGRMGRRRAVSIFIIVSVGSKRRLCGMGNRAFVE